MFLMIHSPTPVPKLDDLELARRCAEGDRQAQKELWADYKRQVHGILFRILGSNRDVEDLVQESFIQIYSSLGRFRGEAKLSTWIARITTRVAFAHIRRRSLSTVDLESIPMPPSGEPSAEDVATVRQAAQHMYGALDKLDAKHRVAFALHVIDERPLKEVAEMMSSSVMATKSRVWRARKEMKRRAQKDPLLAAYLGNAGKSAS